MASPLTAVSLFGAAQGLCLAVGILALRQADKGSRRVGHVLAGLLICVSAVVAVIAIDHAGVIQDRFALTFLEFSLSLIAGPLFLLLARVVIDNAWPPRAFALHFLPTAIWTVINGAAWIERQLADSTLLPIWFPPILWIVGYQMIYTGWMISIAMSAKRQQLHDRRRSLLGTWILFLLVVHIAQIVRFLFRDVEAFVNIVPLTITALLYIISVATFRESKLLAVESRSAKYEHSTLAADQAEQAATRLQELMTGQKLFLDSDLDQASIAEALGLSRHHLSQLVNQSFGTNFNDFVNRYRVEEATDLLRDSAHDHLTIEAIGRRAGFHSRSAFYDAFRRHAQESPSALRRKR